MDSNPSQPPVSTPVDTGMHKEDQQATGGPTSLGVTSEARANPQLSSGTDPHVLADKTKSISDGLEIVLTTPEIGTSNAAKTIDFKDLDFPEDDPIIVVDDSEEDEEEDKNEEIHSITNDETEDISASTPPSPRSIQLQELKNQVLLLQSQKHTLETEKNKVEAEVALLKAQPSFLDVGQLNELLIKLPGDLKDIPSKLEDFTKTVTNLTSQVAELKTLQWELPAEFISLSVQVASVQAKLKTMDALPGLLLNVTKALNKFAQVFDSASSKAGEQGVPSTGQADTMPAEGEKNTNQATISQLFQRRAEKNAERKNLNKPQPEMTPPPILPIITTTTHMFDFVTEDGEHVHLTKEQIGAQKKIEEEAKADDARCERKNKEDSLLIFLVLKWNAIGAHYLPHSSEYVAPPSIDIVRPWFKTIRYGEAVPAKGTLKKVFFLLGGDTIIKLNKKHRETIIPYTRFLSLLMMHKMKEGYGEGELTLYPTQCYKPVVFKAPKTSSKAESVSQGTKPGAKPGHKKLSTSLKQPSVFSKEATKGGSSKVLTSSKTGHSKKRKESSSAIDSNPSQPPVSTPVDTGMHKEDQQATGGPTSLGVTSEARANPQLSSGMSTFNLNEPIYSASFIIHSESASGNDASAASTTEADPGKSAPSNFVPQQQGMNEGTKNTSYNHLFAGASFITRQVEEEASNTIKLKDLEKLVSNVQPSFKDMDSPEDDPVIVVDNSDKDEEDEGHTTTEDISVLKSLSPRPSQIQELTNQILILQSQKHKLEIKKNKVEAEVALLKDQPSFPNMGQLNELLVKFLQTEFSKILYARDFSSSLPTELKDLPSKFNELAEEVKGLKQQVHELEIELPGDLKEIPSKLEDFTKTVASIQAKLKTLDALPGLLLNVTKALNKFAQVLGYASSKAGDQSVPLTGQADTMPAEGEKNTNQATIS
ncbi:hypothetical protein Tco_0969236 [Tanacetum coccineum]